MVYTYIKDKAKIRLESAESNKTILRQTMMIEAGYYPHNRHQTTGIKMAFQIFIVEDHPTMRRAYASLFSRTPDLQIAGMADSGEEALSFIPTSQVDLVLVDLSLPSMSGQALITQIYQMQPTLPILIVSGQESSLYATDQVPSVKGFIQKGEISQRLVVTIRKVLAI